MAGTIDDSSTQTCFWSATRPAALVSPAAAEGEKGEHGTAPVHRSNDDRGALFFDEERLMVLLSLSHARFVFCAGFVTALLGKTRYNCVRASRK